MAPPNRGSSKEYSKDNLKNALDAVRNGMTIHTAGKTFKVPKTTLYNHFKKNLDVDIKPGAPSVLTKDQEGHLCEWIDHMAQIGFPISKDILLDSVEILVKDLKLSHKFKDGRPGRHWYEGFLKRNPSVSKRVAQYLVKSRAQVTETHIRAWFTEIKTYVEQNGYISIFDHPERVFNCDETAFFLSPKENSVLVKKGHKSVYSMVANDEKENITTLVMGNAQGKLGPPMVVLPYKRIPVNIAKSMPASWGIGRSDSGWMTGELFFEYIANIFYPWLANQNIQMPIILFVDGHTSHMTLNLSQFCREKEIILIALLPNSTSILQPMDVAYFHPLKQEWRREIKKWRMEHDGQRIRREDFAPLLSSILKNPSFETNLINGFRACGLCPLDANSINYSKLLTNKIELVDEIKNYENNQKQFNIEKHVEHLEQYMGLEKTNIFETSLTCSSWTGTKEDTSLFDYWKNLKTKISTVNNEEPNDQAEPSYLNIGETSLCNNYLSDTDATDAMEVDLDAILGDNTNVTLHIETDGSVTVDNPIQTPKKISEVQTVKDQQQSLHDHLQTPIKLNENHYQTNNNLPTPFKKNLIWPTPKIGPTSAKRERLPAVVSSTQWIAYTQKKLDKKEKEMNEKEERKKQREAKKENLKTNRSKDTGKGRNLETAEPTIIDKYETQQYIIVKYEGEFFPGIILDKKSDDFFVKVMCMSGNNWKWPDKDDVCWYNKDDLIQKIKEPELVNARGVYSIPEIKSVRDSN